MQFLNLYFGGRCTAVVDHVAHDHALIPVAEFVDVLPHSVNSYHNHGIDEQELAPGFVVLARDSDGNVEAFQHKTEQIAGIMWHPEREQPIRDVDVELLRRFLL